MSLAGNVNLLATRIANYLRDSILPRLQPAGGTAGQALVKSNANNYASTWANVAFSSLSGRPTTLSGYGITDAVVTSGSAPTFTTMTVSASANAGVFLGRRDGTNDAVLYQSQDTFRVFVGEDVLRVQSDGNLWTPYFGFLSDAFNGKISAYTTTQNLEIAHADPILILHYPGIKRGYWKVDSAGNLQWVDQGGQLHFQVDGAGAIWTQQFGDLSTRIEQRAQDWGYAIANNIRTRLVYAGDKGADDPNAQAQFYEAYGGGVITGYYVGTPSGVQCIVAVRFRYLQATDSLGNWYTVSYV